MPLELGFGSGTISSDSSSLLIETSLFVFVRWRRVGSRISSSSLAVLGFSIFPLLLVDASERWVSRDVGTFLGVFGGSGSTLITDLR